MSAIELLASLYSALRHRLLVGIVEEAALG
jgi:hypothetical protein